MELSSEQKGRRAKEILEDEVFVEMIEKVRQGYILRWTLTAPHEIDEREALSASSRGLDEVLRELRTLITDWTVDQQRKNTKKVRKQ
jgi:hypothetical protein|tara:strand:- start:204 stop:464 length:261 start_codon:yes stop_codon:yes gene_type:complete